MSSGNLWKHKHVLCSFTEYTGPWFNIKMSSYQYRKSHCRDKTVVRLSYLYNGISYTGKMSSLYWIRAQKCSGKYEQKTIIKIRNLDMYSLFCISWYVVPSVICNNCTLVYFLNVLAWEKKNIKKNYQTSLQTTASPLLIVMAQSMMILLCHTNTYCVIVTTDGPYLRTRNLVVHFFLFTCLLGS